MEPFEEDLIIYCHGIPGSDEEIDSLIPKGVETPLILGPLDIEGFKTITSDNTKRNIHLIRFSMGAMTALKIANLHPGQIDRITLIAPAAPLELGNFLPHMAGHPVFKMALRGKAVFTIFTALQRLGLFLASNTVIKSMFTDSPAADKRLLDDTDFKASIEKGLTQSLGKNRRAYKQAVHSYVAPWSKDLKNIARPVTIYHGSDDNWAPIRMSHALVQSIPTQTDLVILKNLGHYSALYKALPIVLRNQS